MCVTVCGVEGRGGPQMSTGFFYLFLETGSLIGLELSLAI